MARRAISLHDKGPSVRTTWRYKIFTGAMPKLSRDFSRFTNTTMQVEIMRDLYMLRPLGTDCGAALRGLC